MQLFKIPKNVTHVLFYQQNQYIDKMELLLSTVVCGLCNVFLRDLCCHNVTTNWFNASQHCWTGFYRDGVGGEHELNLSM